MRIQKNSAPRQKCACCIRIIKYGSCLCNKNSLEFYSTAVHGFLTAAASRRWVGKLHLNSWEGWDKYLLVTSAESWASPTLQFFTSREVFTSEHSWGAAILFSIPSKLHNLLCSSTSTPLKEDSLWLQFKDAGIILLLASLSNGNIVDLWKTQST